MPEILLERVDVNPASSDEYGRTPLFLAVGPERIRVVRMPLEPRPFSHQISSNGGRTRQISVPTACPEEVELLGPVSQQEGIISDTRQHHGSHFSLFLEPTRSAPGSTDSQAQPHIRHCPRPPPSCCLQGHWDVIEWPRRLCIVLSASVSLYLNICKNPIFPIYEYM